MRVHTQALKHWLSPGQELRPSDSGGELAFKPDGPSSAPELRAVAVTRVDGVNQLMGQDVKHP